MTAFLLETNEIEVNRRARFFWRTEKSVLSFIDVDFIIQLSLKLFKCVTCRKQTAYTDDNEARETLKVLKLQG